MNKLFFCLIICLFSSPAHAYLDPGLGNIILQSVLGCLALVWGYISLYWHKIKSFILKFRRDSYSKKDEKYKK